MEPGSTQVKSTRPEGGAGPVEHDGFIQFVNCHKVRPFPSTSIELSLDFLHADLRDNVGSSNCPVIVFMHYGFDEYWSQLWWTKHERKRYKAMASKCNMVASFVGHTHVCLMYKRGTAHHQHSIE